MDFSTEQTLAASLERLATGYIPAAVLFAAAELGVFDALDEPLTSQQLAARIGASTDGMQRLCRALAQMGLLVDDCDGYRATDMVRAVLSSKGKSSIAAVLRHHHRHIAPLLARLDDAVRTATPQHAAWAFSRSAPASIPYFELARNPTEYTLFLEGMEHSSRGVGEALAKAIDWSGIRQLVDFGCGGGIVARELLHALPHLQIESHDLAIACSFARGRSEVEGLLERHTIREGDLLAGIETTNADAVLLSAILADWHKDERATILRHAYQALRPGGILLISETLLDDDRRGPLEPAILSLVMLVGMRGDQLSGHELMLELETVGFHAPLVHRMSPRDLVVAKRPLAAH